MNHIIVVKVLQSDDQISNEEFRLWLSEFALLPYVVP